MKAKTEEEIDEITSTDVCLFAYHKIDGIELAQRIYRQAEQSLLPEIERLEAEVKRLKSRFNTLINTGE